MTVTPQEDFDAVLPELPNAYLRSPDVATWTHKHAYTADQMRAYALKAVAATLAERDDLRKDELRLDYIIDNCFCEGGGNGFTLTIRFATDTECIRHAIDEAIKAQEAKQAGIRG